MYSILDFVSIENGNLIQMLKPLETFGSAHVLKCELCEQRGFLCQICKIKEFFKMKYIFYRHSSRSNNFSIPIGENLSMRTLWQFSASFLLQNTDV